MLADRCARPCVGFVTSLQRKSTAARLCVCSIFEFRQSSPGLLDELDLTETNALFIELEDKGRKLLLDAGVSNSDITVSRYAEMRLLGQMHDITIPFPEGSIDSKKLEIVRHDFEKEYTRLYTQLYEGVEIQILNWKVLCSGPSPNAVYD